MGYLIKSQRRAGGIPAWPVMPGLLLSALVILMASPARAAEWITPANAPQLIVQAGHDGVRMGEGTQTLALSRDGRLMASTTDNAVIQLWEVASRRELRSLEGQDSLSLAFSPDGRTLLSGNRDGSLVLLDMASGRVRGTVRAHKSGVSSVAYTADGKTILSAAGNDEHAKVWDAQSLVERHVLGGNSRNGVSKIALSVKGNRVALLGYDGAIRVWDLAPLRLMQSFPAGKEAIADVALSPDGKVLALAEMSNVIRFLDMATGRPILDFRGNHAKAIAYLPDGKGLLAGGSNLVLWNPADGKPLRHFPPGSRPEDVFIHSYVQGVAFSDGGAILLTKNNGGTVHQWNPNSGEELGKFSGAGILLNQAAFSGHGQALIAIGLINPLVWDMFSGQGPRQLWGEGGWFSALAMSPDQHTLVTGKDLGRIQLWDMRERKALREINAHAGGRVGALAYSRDGVQLASASDDGMVKVWDAREARETASISIDREVVKSLVFSPDRKRLLLAIHMYRQPVIRDVASGEEPFRFESGERGYIVAADFSPDGTRVVSAHWNGIILWDALTGKSLHEWQGHSLSVSAVVFSPDGKTFLSASEDGTLKLWDAGKATELRTYSGHAGKVKHARFSPDGRLIVSTGSDRSLKLWEASTGRLLATLVAFSDGRWVVVDPAGRFDVADLENMPHLHWVMADDPFMPLPVEIFIRDYYEPRLLSRIVNGEVFKPVRPVSDINRVQPEVRIAGIEAAGSHHVLVTVEAAGRQRRYGREGKMVSTAVHDLRLFRNGQLVGYVNGKLATAHGKPFKKTFKVRLPAGSASDQPAASLAEAIMGTAITFSAYALNDDRVKSQTAREVFYQKAEPAPARPRAYLITVGVNRHENPSWDLRYAANDARQIRESMLARLKGRGYEDVVSVLLVSDGQQNLATKGRLKAVLDRLAGKAADVGGIPGAEGLRQATPDDLVLISFSGHGYNEGGLFYLIPGDTGPGNGKALTPALNARSISSDELSEWLKDVDAGDMAMVVDACHSAASVGSEFKPGPMGSRGLGQLAFDKGMRILAASQADDVALEDDRIQQGLLSYALVKDGLEQGRADHKPQDRRITLEEWLSYGVSRVPLLAEEMKSGKLAAVRGTGRGFEDTDEPGEGAMRRKASQQPSLFDFTKGRRDVLLDAVKP